MQKKVNGSIAGVPKEEKQWCEKNQKYVIRTYCLHPVLNTRFDEFCTEEHTCVCECEYKHNV